MKLALIGLGSVGRGVAHVVKNDPRFKIVAAADSKSGAVNPDGLDIDRLLQGKKETGRIGKGTKILVMSFKSEAKNLTLCFRVPSSLRSSG